MALGGEVERRGERGEARERQGRGEERGERGEGRGERGEGRGEGRRERRGEDWLLGQAATVTITPNLVPGLPIISR
jgi:hypothetical protein